MRSIRTAAILTFILAPAAIAQNTGTNSAAQAAATITANEVRAHIAFIASDSLKGRDTPSPGLEAAANYVADHFKSLGLKPAGDSGTFIQRWPYNVSKLDRSKVNVELQGTAGVRTLQYGKDFFLLASPALDTLSGTILFGGPATAQTQMNPAFGGQVVAFFLAGKDLNATWQQAVQATAIAAVMSGARAVVFLLDPAMDAASVGMIASGTEAQQAPIPILGVRGDMARQWLKGTAADVEVPAAAPAAPFPVTAARLSVRSAIAASSSRPPNVVAILEGSDSELKNTYVIYSAHMDHIGVGAPNEKGDSINNGADDDASGTTAVLEVAQAFASLKQRPRRSIIFLAVSGEEKGLFGSKYFVDHSPVPVEKIVADINIDMIGRNNPDSTVAIGQEYSSLGEATQAVVKAHPELHLTVAPDLWPEEKLFFRSDHFNFAMKKIPAIFFTSGLHADYHRQSDEPATIDNDKLARTARLVFWLGYDVANNATAPTWTEAGLKAVRAAAPAGEE